MDAITIKHAGAMPAPTWGWLKMNDTQIAIPAGMARGGDIVVEAAQELTSTALSFEGAVAALQERVDAARDDAQDSRACIQAVQEQHAPGDDLGDLNIPALSTYQERACKEELANDVAGAFATGMGIDTRSYLNFSAGETLVLGCAEGTEETATIRVRGEQGTTVAASIDAVAEAGAHLTLAISLDGEADAASAEPGLVGSELRVFAGENARVDVTVYTTCDAPFTAIDDSGYVLDRNAHPYVYAQQWGVQEADTTLAEVGDEVHAIIESDLDVLMLQRKRNGATVADYPPESELVTTERINKVAGALTSYMALSVYGLDVGANEYGGAVADMKLAYRLIEPAGSPVSAAIGIFEGVARGHSLLGALAHRVTRTAPVRAGNLNHYAWENPFTGQVSHESFPEVFDRALDDYAHTAELFMEGAAMELVTEGLDYSGKQA